MKKNDYEAIVIGSGPGGYVCAIRCAQLGMKTALVEKSNALGGTCLNRGCIPSKALLDSSEHYHQAANHFDSHGIELGEISLNWNRMQARKQKVVSDTNKGLDCLMSKNKIKVLNGLGRFVSGNKIAVASGNDTNEYIAERIIIATGSTPSALPGIEVDGKVVITSDHALFLDKIPASMTIVGGGVIGLELGSVYARLGTEVNVIEFFDRILPGMDSELSKLMLASLKKIGIKFHLGHRLISADAKNNRAEILASDKNGKELRLHADHCLISVGRQPFTDGLGLDNTKAATDSKGFLKVDKNLETHEKGVYAIGDVIGNPMLAHKAEEEGVFVAESIAGQKPHINYSLIPGVVYTWPEAAGVGATEQELIDKGIPHKKGSFPFSALGRARASNDTQGMVKILRHRDTDEILGAHIFGARASDLIAEIAVAMEYKAGSEDLARICHAHPTFSEAIKEACLAASDLGSIHL